MKQVSVRAVSNRTCGSCRNIVEAEASWCPSCGVMLPLPAELPPGLEVVESERRARPRGRRAFLAGAGGVLALASAGGGVFALRNRGRPAVVEAEEEEPEPTLVSQLAAYEPDRSRVYSRASYEGLVQAAAPYQVMAKRAEQAVTPVGLRAVEKDAFFDDIYTREGGSMVILGEQDGMLIGFTHRYFVDMRYPANSLHGDGVGAAEWGRHSLVVGRERFALQPLARHGRGAGNSIGWEGIGDHDAAILTIPKTLGAFAALPSLGIPEPASVVRELVRDSSKLFGLGFVLVSPQAFDDLRQGASSQMLTLQVFLAGVALGALFFTPLLGQLAAGVTVSQSTLAQLGRRVVAKGLPIVLDLVGGESVGAEGLLGRGGELLKLLGVELPRDAKGLAMIRACLDAILPSGSGHYVPYEGSGEGPGAPGGQLFVPDREMSLNAELLGRGLARLDLNNLDALREHPQLVDAALSALDADRNLAAGWSGDEAYRGMIEMLQRG